MSDKKGFMGLAALAAAKGYRSRRSHADEKNKRDQ